MGRASLGVRRQCNIRLRPDLIARIDSARGPLSRDAWFERAAELALKPIAAIRDPELKQDVHEHTAQSLIGTTYRGGQKLRTYACSCGYQIERTA